MATTTARQTIPSTAIRSTGLVDPAAKKIPFRGKLIWTYGLCFVTFPLFLAGLIINNGHEAFKDNPLLGPSPESLLLLGGLNGQKVRQGEWWRLFWSPYLHAGWIHFFVNWIVWFKIGEFVEPDWGFWRTFVVFVLSSFTGNLFSATLDPNVVSVGASGGIFGVIGACIPYIIEYWDSIRYPRMMMFCIIISMVTSLATGFIPFVDNYAHLGGAVSGILVGFATITRNGVAQKNRRKHYTETETVHKRPASSREPFKQIEAKRSADDKFFSFKKWMPSFKAKKDEVLESVRIQEENKNDTLMLKSYMSSNVSINDESEEKSVVSSYSVSKADWASKVKNGEHSESVTVEEPKKVQTSVNKRQFRTPQRSEYVPSRLTIRSVPIALVARDEYEWSSCSLWVIRGSVFGLQVLVWIVLFYFLLVCPECYKPPGQIFTPASSLGTRKLTSPFWSSLDYLYDQLRFPVSSETTAVANFRGTSP